jgi:hypothetical protein
MNRNSDLDYVKLHIQELYDEAERYRQVKNSQQFKPTEHTRWYIRLSDRITAWIAWWRCTLRGRLPQNLFPGLNDLILSPNPCGCAPEPCTE